MLVQTLDMQFETLGFAAMAGAPGPKPAPTTEAATKLDLSKLASESIRRLSFDANRNEGSV